MSIVVTGVNQSEMHYNKNNNNGTLDLLNGDEEEDAEEETDRRLSVSPANSKTNLKATTPPSRRARKHSSSVIEIENREKKTTSRTSPMRHRSLSKTRVSSKSIVVKTASTNRSRSRSRSVSLKNRPRNITKSRSRSRSRSRSSRRRSNSRSRQRINKYSRSRSVSRTRPSKYRRSRSRSPLGPNHHRSAYAFRGGYQQRPYNSKAGGRHLNGPYRSPDSFYDRFNAPQNNVLAVFGLDKRANEQDLFDVYRKYGCKECKIIMDKHTGSPKGYGFVYFTRVEDASKARQKTDGFLLLRKNIRVDFSIGERDFAPHLPTTTLTTQQLLEKQQQEQQKESSNYYNTSLLPYNAANRSSNHYHSHDAPPPASSSLPSSHHHHIQRERGYDRKERSPSRNKTLHVESSSFASSYYHRGYQQHHNHRDLSPPQMKQERDPRDYQRYERMPPSPRSPVSYHETMLATSTIAKSKPHNSYSIEPNYTHQYHQHQHNNHGSEKIKVVVNYEDNDGVKKRTSRLIQENSNYTRGENGNEIRKIVTSSKKYTNIRSPSSSPPPHSRVGQSPHRLIRSPSNSPPNMEYYHSKYSQQRYKPTQQREMLERRVRSRSRSRTPSRYTRRSPDKKPTESRSMNASRY